MARPRKPHLAVTTTLGWYLRSLRRAASRGRQAIKAEENLDGKYTLCPPVPKLPAEGIASGRKQLPEVERCWRDLEQVTGLRPLHRRDEERIRAAVMLCWLALLMADIAENACHGTWPQIHRELDRIRLAAFTGCAGTFWQRAELTTA